MLADINGNLADLRSEAAMASQRFCLRWNNHQSNLLSVFDQLLHDEAFVDVTLAVEGQLLKAHKMVLSACSPYFQALFTNHPDKHPIVILKDVPYADMRSLLDFMYRGEVSVDQERLTAFLRVAESLRIKGLTEVNEDKCDLPSITSSLLANQNSGPLPPPNLHRINQLGQHQLPQKRYHHQMSSHPMLGSALSAPKRKRGRPRKLSGSSDTPMDTSLGHDQQCSELLQGSPELMELKMGLDLQSEAAQNSSAGSSSVGSNTSHNNQSSGAAKRDAEPMENGTEATEAMLLRIKGEPEPTPGTSAQDFTRSSSCSSNSSVKSDVSDKSLGSITPEKSTTPSAQQQQQQQLASNESSPRATPSNNNNNNKNNPSTLPTPSSNTKNNNSSSTNNNSVASTQSSTSTTSTATTTSTRTTTTTTTTPTPTRSPSPRSSSLPRGVPSTPPSQQQTQSSGAMSAPTGRQVPKRRMRRKTSSQSQDPAEQLTEMSVRGLNLFRYASISEGVYQCTECAKVDIQKTFKNKYSFQRHAFLYHEGHQRKVFPCPVCSKEFSRPDKMKNHMKTVHDCFMPKDCVNLPFGFYMQP
ncbi:protein tramtrack, alpha isoform [Copidosoma floridanum]|uniref:protein tramtrack, alpha isoform n=1 Tax=Copidosoma floridanum TaxID=29053 RepID=UPI0006C9B163|nr:protein tramtrack, alpha isoform [Copidosoma floridanum]XP_023244963.1 protein tramtrack, alpha isoform [Copidosoma floridanum]